MWYLLENKICPSQLCCFKWFCLYWPCSFLSHNPGRNSQCITSKIRLSRHSFCLLSGFLGATLSTIYKGWWRVIKISEEWRNLPFFFLRWLRMLSKEDSRLHITYLIIIFLKLALSKLIILFFFFGSGMLQCRSSWNGRGGIWGNWCWGSGCKEFSSHGQNLLWAKQTTGRRGDSKKVVGFGKLSFLRNRDSKAVLVSWRRISLP